MLSGVMTLWFIQVLLCVVFVVIDVRRTPEPSALKSGFVVVTVYSGPIGALPYVVACREPLPNTHAEYVRARWRQVTGSTMHCVAGDGLGILFAAAVPRDSDCRPGLTCWPSMPSVSCSGGLYFRRCSCARWPAVITAAVYA